ncbi:ABC transporter substrate-binding protein [Caldovatus aquaticus]|uniref:ABC transporter substrate-binding protein n=1 Tax=Caldovatus aquaticus TaxID=2865671 RepID=A0ABS7EX91_9PROT|nr:ABC transporter substrate-binding protein [Caldovatus aquaticus]MBW8267978.1 ABC transporter substrate-binding protein [Caldovatus aquaticus]
MTEIARRTLLRGFAATAAAGTLAAPAVHAQPAAVRIGFLTVKTGPLASGGIQMEQGLLLYLKERDMRLAGRPVELFTADTGGVPAQARTKTQELAERNRVHCIIGPLAAFEALAIDDYIRQVGLPTLSVAAAEDMTQRNPNPWFVRATSTSAQCAHPMADYAAKELRWRRAAVIADDIAYGHEMLAGFQRVFEDNGGRIVQKLWPPLAVPDYGTYISQFKANLDGIFMGFAGSNGFRFVRQFHEYGLGGRIPLTGGMTAVDESLLQNMGNEALGIISACWYSAELDNPVNRRFVEMMRREHRVDPGFYAAATYTNGAVLEAALRAVDGRVEDKQAFMNALRTNRVEETCRGPVRFDQYGNVVGNVYIRRVERKGGRLVNTVIKTYADVSQFWTYDPQEFLRNPVYSRNWPPARHLEN